MQTVFLSGNARSSRGPGQVAEISQVRYTNGGADIIPDGTQIGLDQVRVQLNGYTLNTFQYTVDLAGQASRGFNEHPFEISRMLEVQTDGTLVPLSAPGQTAFRVPTPFDVNVRVFPGRVSTVTMRLDDNMVSYSDSEGRVVFNSDLFVTSNYSDITNSITSSFTDYVSFDISGLGTLDRPTLSTSGDPADRVFFSGDGIGISRGMGSSSEFDLLDPVVIRSGQVSTGPLIGPTGQQVQGANLIVLDDVDPLSTRITSLVGTWKEFNRVIVPTDTVSAVAFPSSRETDNPNDVEEQQFVIFANSGNNIIAMWQGQVFYNTAGDRTRGTFRLFPLDTIDDAVPSGEVSGTVSNLRLSADGFVLSGDWDVAGTPSGDWPFPARGGFSVFRR